MRRLATTILCAAGLGLGATAGTAQAHEMSCRAHLPPIHVQMTLAGYRCIKYPGWHDRIRYYMPYGLGYLTRDVILLRHSPAKWLMGHVIFVRH